MFDKLKAIFGGRDEAVGELLQAAEQIRADLRAKVLLFADECIDDYVAFVKRWPPHLINEYKKEIRKARTGQAATAAGQGFSGSNADPRQWVYNYVISKTAAKITSGECQIYPGVLSIEGNGYRQVFEQCVTNMVALGAYTEKWAHENWRMPVAEALRGECRTQRPAEGGRVAGLAATATDDESLDDDDMDDDDWDSLSPAQYAARRAAEDRAIETYHKQIDEQIVRTHAFLRERFGEESVAGPHSLQTVAVFTVHAATLVARKRYFPDLHRGSLNGFTRSLGFSTPNPLPDVEPPPGMLVSRIGRDESFMYGNIEIHEAQGVGPVVRRLLAMLVTRSDEDYDDLLRHVDYSADQIAKTYMPFLAKE